MHKDAKHVLAGMEPWLDKRGKPVRNVRDRTPEQRAWDSAILAASEFVRRITNYDEELAGAIHCLLTQKQ